MINTIRDGRIPRIIVAAALILLGFAGTRASALDYPNRRITIVVGFSAGGAIDIAARILGESLAKRLGQTVVVENRLGAESNIASKAVVDAAPDGYTLLLASNSLIINQSYYPKLNFSIRQLTPVAIVGVGDGAGFAVNAGQPARTFDDFMTEKKTKSFTLGAGGAFARIVADYFFRVITKMDTVFVPYNGSALSINALIGNHIDTVSAPVSEYASFLGQGTIRVLAVAGTRRSPSLPETPTLAELGYKGFEVSAILPLMVPAATPPEICDALNAAVNQSLTEPDLVERMRQLGFFMHPTVRPAIADMMAEQLDTWTRMVKATGMEVH
jgi:tripartite-type tricarboxylate transporter receptor subunit TctC